VALVQFSGAHLCPLGHNFRKSGNKKSRRHRAGGIFD
jgi:hypothetical protein